MEVRAHTIGGAGLRSFFEWFGELGLLTARAARAAIHPPYELREFFRHLDEAGSQSAPLVAVAPKPYTPGRSGSERRSLGALAR